MVVRDITTTCSAATASTPRAADGSEDGALGEADDHQLTVCEAMARKQGIQPAVQLADACHRHGLQGAHARRHVRRVHADTRLAEPIVLAIAPRAPSWLMR